MFQDFSKAGGVKQSDTRPGDKRMSKVLGCSLIQLVRWLIVIDPFPTDNAEWSNLSQIIVHCLLTPKTP